MCPLSTAEAIQTDTKDSIAVISRADPEFTVSSPRGMFSKE